MRGCASRRCGQQPIGHCQPAVMGCWDVGGMSVGYPWGICPLRHPALTCWKGNQALSSKAPMTETFNVILLAVLFTRRGAQLPKRPLDTASAAIQQSRVRRRIAPAPPSAGLSRERLTTNVTRLVSAWVRRGRRCKPRRTLAYPEELADWPDGFRAGQSAAIAIRVIAHAGAAAV